MADVLHGVRLLVIVGKYALHEPLWHVWPFDDFEEWRTRNLLQRGTHCVVILCWGFTVCPYDLEAPRRSLSFPDPPWGPIIPLSSSYAYLQGIVSFPYVSVSVKGNSTSLDSHNESPRCSPSYKRSISLGLSSVGLYSLWGSSSPVATLEL